MMEIITERRFRWFGHVIRMEESRITKRVLEWKPIGKRKRGRQKLTWKDQVSKDLVRVDMTWNEAQDASRD